MSEIRIIRPEQAVIINVKDLNKIKETIAKVREWIREHDTNLIRQANKLIDAEGLIQSIDKELAGIEIPEE